MARPPLFRVEQLEDRSQPAVLGSPWPDAAALSISFAPDSARNGADKSALFKTLNAVAPAAVWQGEILRAFQAWAAVTNVNLGLIRDGGQDFGTPGDIQGDTRFGDIRIGAGPLVGSLANTAPFSWGVGTWSGDVILNSATRFAINPTTPAAGADLFTVALHEAGHALGLGESDDPSSVMYGAYAGTRTGLSAGDIAAARALYGARTADRYEGPTGNGTFGSAAALAGAGTIQLTADISSAGDADVFSFVQRAGAAATVRVATTGLSLLNPDVAVYDASGVLVKRLSSTDVVSTDAAKGDVTLVLDRLVTGATYYVRVAGATADAFGTGRYQLTVAWGPLAPAAIDTFEKDAGTNNTPQMAGPLPASESGTGYAVDATLEGKTDVDWYRVAAPAATDGTDQAVVVRLRALNAKSAVPTLSVLDASGQAVPYQVLASDDQTITIQVLGNRRATDYFIGVGSPAGTDATGNYRLTATFQPPDGSNLTRLTSGQLGGGAGTTVAGTLVVTESRLFQFDVLATAAGATAATAVTFTLRDAAGKVVLTLTQGAGQPAPTAAVYLGPGTYAVEITQAVEKKQTPPPMNYWLYANVASDPVGTRPTTTTGTTADVLTPVAASPSAYFYSSPMTATATMGYAITF